MATSKDTLDEFVDPASESSSLTTPQDKTQASDKEEILGAQRTNRALERDQRLYAELAYKRATAPRLTPMSGPVRANSREREAVMAQRRAARWTPGEENLYRDLGRRLGYDSPERSAFLQRQDRGKLYGEITRKYNLSPKVEAARKAAAESAWKKKVEAAAKTSAMFERDRSQRTDKTIRSVYGDDQEKLDLFDRDETEKTKAYNDIMHAAGFYRSNVKDWSSMVSDFNRDLWKETTDSKKSIDELYGDGVESVLEKVIASATPTKVLDKDGNTRVTKLADPNFMYDNTAFKQLSPKEKLTLVNAIYKQRSNRSSRSLKSSDQPIS